MSGPTGARRVRVLASFAAALLVVSCGGSDDAGDDDAPPTGRDPVDPPSFVTDALAAIDAVEAELGDGQAYFEVTANDQFTNVFVAVDGASAVAPYLYVDGELQPPAPVQEGAAGATFTADDVEFDAELLLSGVAVDLPDTSIDALSIYGDGIGAVYVLGATSQVGGQLDIVVTGTGAIVSVDPL